jgi:hypothetical protein
VGIRLLLLHRRILSIIEIKLHLILSVQVLSSLKLVLSLFRVWMTLLSIEHLLRCFLLLVSSGRCWSFQRRYLLLLRRRTWLFLYIF